MEIEYGKAYKFFLYNLLSLNYHITFLFTTFLLHSSLFISFVKISYLKKKSMRQSYLNSNKV